jgi:hypothetical protein
MADMEQPGRAGREPGDQAPRLSEVQRDEILTLQQLRTDNVDLLRETGSGRFVPIIMISKLCRCKSGKAGRATVGRC